MGRECDKYNKYQNWSNECTYNQSNYNPYQQQNNIYQSNYNPCQQQYTSCHQLCSNECYPKHSLCKQECSGESCCCKESIFYALKVIKNVGIDVTVKSFNDADTNSVSGEIVDFDNKKEVVQIGNEYVSLCNIVYIELKDNFDSYELPADCKTNKCCCNVGLERIIKNLGNNLGIKLINSSEPKNINVYSVCKGILWGRIGEKDVAIPLCSILSVYTAQSTTTLAPIGSISGVVWIDLDESGYQEIKEEGVEKVTVELYEDDGDKPISKTTTDKEGKYLFENVKPGVCYVKFSKIPEGCKFINSNKTVDENGETECFTLELGENKEVDCPILSKPIIITTTTTTSTSTTTSTTTPLAPLLLSSVEGVVWVDLNKNGKQDKNEPEVEGVIVEIFSCGGTIPIKTVTTNVNGSYKFSNMNQGSYYIKFDKIPKGYIFIDSNKTVDENGETECFTLELGENKEVNCPILTKPTTTTTSAPLVTLGGIVWVDDDENGEVDDKEVKVPNVMVKVYESCESTSPLTITTTDENGRFLFINLESGSYYVKFSEIPEGYKFIQSNKMVDKEGKTICFVLAAGENKLDINCPILPIPPTTTTTSTTTTSTTTTSTTTTNIPVKLPNIEGVVWIDSNENGKIDDDEPIVEGVTVDLYIYGKTSPFKTAITNTNYRFSDINPGNYFIKFSNIPKGYKFIQSNKLVDENGEVETFSVGLGETKYINCPILLIPTTTTTTTTSTTTPGTAQPFGSISGIVWEDSNENGATEEKEQIIVGVEVWIYECGKESPFKITTTDENGKYVFENMEEGSYYMKFNKLPEEYKFINSNNILEDVEEGVTPCFDLGAGETIDYLSCPVLKKE